MELDFWFWRLVPVFVIVAIYRRINRVRFLSDIFLFEIKISKTALLKYRQIVICYLINPAELSCK